jgi:uncharacterized membrane protein
MSEKEKTALGLSPNLTATLSYVLGLVSGLVVFVLEKENRFVRFHAMQSIILSVVTIIFYFVAIMMGRTSIIGLIFSTGWIVFTAFWFVGMINAAQGKDYKLPIIGFFAKKQI